MSPRALLLIGALIGIVALGLVRFVGQPPEEHGAHYHANWAVFIDGERLDLSGNRYMEDVYQCSVDPGHQRPEDRVHMHENNHDVVHVHATGVAWGHLLANLGFGVGDDYLDLGPTRYESLPPRTLKFILNGAPVASIRNRPIGDRDRLLISFGSESPEEAISAQYATVAANAEEYNRVPDPASCSGHPEETLWGRIKRAWWF